MYSLRAQDLNYQAGDFNLKIQVCEIIAQKINVIIGPNGAGKSTLLNILADLKAPYAGNVFINDEKIERIKEFELAKIIAYVPQNDEVFGNPKVSDLIALGRLPLRKTSQTNDEKDKEKTEEIARELGCEKLLNREYETLSGGEKRLVRLACALVIEPKILMIDEPFNHLDIKHQMDFIKILNLLRDKGMTIVVIVHDLNIAANWGDNIILMKGGKIIAKGCAKDVISSENLAVAYGIDAKLIEIQNRNFVQILGD